MPFKLHITSLICILTLSLHSQHNGGTAYFIPNEGQWPGDFEYQLKLNQGGVFFKRDGYRTSIHQENHNSNEGHVHGNNDLSLLVYNMQWVGADQHTNTKLSGWNEAPFYHNYFIGKDPARWKSKVKLYHKLVYEDLYPGIDLRYYGLNGRLKYDIIVRPGASLNQMKMRFEGIDKLQVEEGRLELETPLGDIKEWIPSSYQMINGSKIDVECHYHLEGNEVSFQVRNYNPDYPLIIDPVLEFSSFTGSAGANWGFTATYNSQGEFYGGGTSFNNLYPTTTGVFQDSSGGQVDIAISKFSSDGSSLLYSTYLGGSRREAPHSLVANAQDELFILGNSGSDDFPITSGAYQSNYVNGNNISLKHLGFDYPQGSQIVVAKLSTDGTALKSSTYFGGDVAEGINLKVYKNYGDFCRGEIIALDNGNIAISSNSLSTNLPLSRVGVSATDSTQNAIVAVFNSNLSNLVWGNYFGGNDHETGYSLRTDGTHIFLGGATASTDIPAGNNVVQNSLSGSYDGYIAKFNAATGQFIEATYLGTAQLDQTFLIEVDQLGNVFAFGQSNGSMPITPGKYSNPNSRQFIQKYNNDLTNMKWSTQIGSGNNKSDLVPTAFMVDFCQNIYLSGWNGQANHAANSFSNANTNNLPVTPDAFQTSTDGSDFYFMILGRDADSLLFGTYFGGSSDEHVDGGTSRFSPKGVIYQAACAGCRSSSGFPTTPQAYAPAKPNSQCNLGAVKFDFEISVRSVPFVDFGADVDTICDDLEVTMTNNSLNANKFYWDFGNGQSSTLEEPTVTYTSFGTYTVTLVAFDTICGISDTNTIEVDHDKGITPQAESSANYVGCDQEYEVKFVNNSNDATSYFWIFGDGQTSQSPAPIHNYPDSGTYNIMMVAYDSICNTADTSFMEITFTDSTIAPDIELDYSGCNNGLLKVQIKGGRDRYIYHWDMNGYRVATGRKPELKVTKSGTQNVMVTIEDTLCNSQAEQELSIYIEELEQETFIPNVFTPNGDDINERFILTGTTCGDQTQLRIFNRWGQLVFETNNPFSEFWDGRINGRKAPDGVYSYILINGDQEIRNHLTLIR